jgi:sec-independent protein translocase protein TatB
MSGIGFSELIILFLIGLIVLGPQRLPRVASQLGTWLGQARRMTRVMRRQLEDELNLEKELSIRPPPRPARPADDSYSPNYAAKHETADADSPTVGTDANKAAEDIAEEKGA